LIATFRPDHPKQLGWGVVLARYREVGTQDGAQHRHLILGMYRSTLG
jgi:hypothetical protein